MEEMSARSALLLGWPAVEKLAACHVAVFGVGGVGGHAVEALARGGVGHITLFDSDEVNVTNLNRQLAATVDALGQKKVDVMAKRIHAIRPRTCVTANAVFYLPENAGEYPLTEYDYIVDAIDTVSAKLELICRAKAAGIPIISAMGCGNKLDPTCFQVTDLFKTSGDPLARVMRHELRKRNVHSLKVVYSTEPARTPMAGGESKGTAGRPAPGSVSFVPGVAGMILAGEVIKDLTGVR